MAISRIGTQDATGSGTSAATATYAATPTQGNLLIAILGDDNGSTTLANSGWSSAATVGTSNTNLTILYKIAGASEPTTITSTTDVGASRTELAIYEYTGFVGTISLDRTSINSNVVTSGLTLYMPPTSSTSSANELCIAGANWNNSNTISSWSNGYNTRNSVNSHLFTADSIIASSQNTFTTVVTTGTAGQTSGAIATFKGVTTSPSVTGLSTTTNLSSITF